MSSACSLKLHSRVVLVAAVLGTLLWIGACAPELGNSRPPDVMEFDPSAQPPRSPEPNVVVINPETGLIDFSVLGTPLPAYSDACVD